MYNNAINPNHAAQPVHSDLTSPAAPQTANHLFEESYSGARSTYVPIPSSIAPPQADSSDHQSTLPFDVNVLPPNVHQAYQSNSADIQITLDSTHENTLLPSGIISDVNSVDFNKMVLQSALPVLVKFDAKWCGPCKTIKPFLEAIAKNHAHDLRITRVDVDESSDIADTYKIEAMPTLVLFKNGQEEARIRGAQSEENLNEFVNNHLKA